MPNYWKIYLTTNFYEKEPDFLWQCAQRGNRKKAQEVFVGKIGERISHFKKIRKIWEKKGE
jgi:hypothetical protein